MTLEEMLTYWELSDRLGPAKSIFETVDTHHHVSVKLTEHYCCDLVYKKINGEYIPDSVQVFSTEAPLLALIYHSESPQGIMKVLQRYI